MSWVVRVVVLPGVENVCPQMPDIWLEQLRYAGMVRVHRGDQVFDLLPPGGVDNTKVWAEQTAGRMASFGYNAVAAPVHHDCCCCGDVLVKDKSIAIGICVNCTKVRIRGRFDDGALGFEGYVPLKKAVIRAGGALGSSECMLKVLNLFVVREYRVRIQDLEIVDDLGTCGTGE
ncbi:hypothetical protein LCGC14_0479320 [marine sediment metagenome]|uniref:Uncharacterized protein n=1 Tax=marine sediment metagenome TaxID=412755 RepID=A0A0F9UWP8_9ZZZZ